MALDKTQYQFNNQSYGKGPLVYAVIKAYIEEVKPTFNELVSEFSNENIGIQSCVISKEEYQRKFEVSNDIARRYFINRGKLVTSDGVEILINSQWEIGNINQFIHYTNDMGYTVLAEIDGETILSFFEKYKANPRKDWITRYQQRAGEVAVNIGKNSSEFTKQFIDDLWKNSNNGIANVSPGSLSNEEYEKLLPELPELTHQILNSPDSKTLTSVYQWADQAKKMGKFNFIKWGVIHRVFAAVDPQHLTTLLNEDHLKKLINVLNNRYAFSISPSVNWVDRNIALKKSLKSAGISDAAPTIVNTFIWELYVALVQNYKETTEPYKEEKVVDEPPKETAPLPIGSPENIILYGPPGTGKTFKLQELTQNKYTSDPEVLDTNIWLRNKINEISWFDVLVLILLDLGGENDVTSIIEHGYFKAKIEALNRTSNIRQAAWSVLQTHTIIDSVTVKYEKRIEPLIFNKTESSRWFIVDENDDQLSEYKQQLNELKSGPKGTETIKRFEFVTFHQSYGYEEFVEGLRPVTNEKGDINYIVEPGVFKRICKLAETDPAHRYAIVIDEINRGNISKIFGELISLIEVDKRAGEINELTVTLPYSKTYFSVPANLDIIGTMNTADRSLAHIDIALRRRFQFEELRTNYSLLSEDVEGINIKRMLFAMNQRIELLLDREHIIGHALLMNVATVAQLANEFETAILPLLEEYFFEDWGKIKQVFNGNDIIQENKDIREVWLGSTDEYAPKSFSVNRNILSDVSTYQYIYHGVANEAFSECDEAGQ